MAALTLRARHKGVREGARGGERTAEGKNEREGKRGGEQERAGREQRVERRMKEREKYATRPTESLKQFLLYSFFAGPKTSVAPAD